MLRRAVAGMVVIAVLSLPQTAMCSTQDERASLEHIEELILKDDFSGAERLCNMFITQHRHSRYRQRVLDLKSVVSKKLNSPQSKKISIAEPGESIAGGDSYSDGKMYLVQAGAFSKNANADKVVRALKRKGFEAISVEEGGVFKVRAGKFKDYANAERLMRNLKKAGYAAHIINEQ